MISKTHTHLFTPSFPKVHDPADRRSQDPTERFPCGFQHGAGMFAHGTQYAFDFVAGGVA